MGDSASNMAAKTLNNSNKSYLYRTVISAAKDITLAATQDCVFLTTWQSDGKRSPNKSIFLNLSRWKALCQFAEDIDRQVDRCKYQYVVEEKCHLGGHIYATVSSHWSRVDIRFWYVPENDNSLKPGRPGLSLDFTEWEALKQSLKETYKLLRLDGVECCLFEPTHQNLMDALNCPECHPPDRFVPKREAAVESESVNSQPPAVYNPKQKFKAVYLYTE